ncbi:ATP-binding cassette domain-containing protein [Klebsiella variicola]|nr:ATP-binding cassette domain-containing protein [Klebsiella variicola]
MSQPLLAVNNLTHLYAPDKGFRDVSFELWPGEVLGIVGESGSGKTTLLKAISARLTPQQGEVLYQQRSLYAMSEAERRRLLRTEWGVVHQHPMDGLRRQVSAGGNIGEPADGHRRPPLRQHSRHRRKVAAGGGDPALTHRRPAHYLFRRHAAASADRPQSGYPAEAGVYG